MFLAMNRFRIAPGMEEGFEKIWRERQPYLGPPVLALFEQVL